jgi:hypothetical protein
MERYWEESRLHITRGFSFPPSILFSPEEIKSAAGIRPHTSVF